MHKYGWIPSLPDHNDRIHEVTARPLQPLVDLRAQQSAVYDQLDLGSCTSNMACGQLDFLRNKEGVPFLYPSRLFHYYCERVLENTVMSDSGATIRDAYKVLNKQGVPPEAEWPYNINQFAARPPAQDYTDALLNKVLQYASVPRTHIKATVAQNLCVGIGISVYESFESPQVAATGMVPMPQPREQLLGGHAVLIVGYDDSKQAYIVRNSWGTGWGIQGYFYLPYAYLADPQLSSDFWVAKLVEK